MYISLFVL